MHNAQNILAKFTKQIPLVIGNNVQTSCQLRIDKVELLPSKRKPIQEARTTRVIGVILLAPLQINTLFENFN